MQPMNAPEVHHGWSIGEVETETGKLCYRYRGSGPIVIALHGIQSTADAWEDVAEGFSKSYTFVAPDMRGRAPSMIPTSHGEYRLDRFAGDLEDLIDQVGQPVMTIGWSMGVLVLLEYFRRGGRQPKVISLVGGTAFLGKEARWFEGLSQAAVLEEAMQRAKRLQLARSASPFAVAASWLHARNCDYRESLPDISSPTLVIHGADDDQCPLSHADLLAGSLPNAKLEVWPRCGHNVMDCDAERFVASVQGFARKHIELRLEDTS